jgi:hypothetical protein
MGNDHSSQNRGLKSPRVEKSRSRFPIPEQRSCTSDDYSFQLNDEALSPELYQTQLPTLLGIIGSPLLLFRLHESEINTQEGSSLLAHIKHAQKTCKAHRALNSDFNSDLKVWKCVLRSTASTQYDLSRGAETPAFTGQDANHLADKEETQFDQDADPDALRASFVCKSRLFEKLSDRTFKKLKKTERQLRMEAGIFFFEVN